MKRPRLKADNTDLLREIGDQLQAQLNELLAEYRQCQAELQSARDHDTGSEEATELTLALTPDVLVHLRREILDIQDALERIKDGTFGRCADCGAPIAAARLRAVPMARRCKTCQVGLERKAG